MVGRLLLGDERTIGATVAGACGAYGVARFGTERERLQAEAERERLQNQLHQAQRLESLGQLAGGIAHDFNNLLAVIINYAEFIANDLKVPTISNDSRLAMAEDIEEVRRASERAAHLTHQLLAFARREVVQPEVVDINEVVSDIEQLLHRTLGEHIELHSSLAADARSVLIDPGQLEQILVNLAVNARDAMPDGGTLRIDTSNIDIDEEYVESRPELSPGHHVRLRVSDSGVGMSPETVLRAFDPFFTTKPPGQGTGLGLATMYGIIQQAGGHSQIYSEPNIGTTFTVLLPATDQTAPPTEGQAESPAPRSEATILLAEDEQALREVTRRILTGAGYKVIVAENGPTALRAAREHTGTIDMLLSALARRFGDVFGRWTRSPLAVSGRPSSAETQRWLSSRPSVSAGLAPTPAYLRNRQRSIDL